MTRVNLVPVNTLSDQHLMAEWREIPRIASSVQNRLQRGPFTQQLDEFVLGEGHMIFFYDKMAFLSTRYKKLAEELKRRKYQITEYQHDPFLDTPEEYHGKWRPKPSEVNISKQRLVEKLERRRLWYRYYGTVRPTKFFIGLMK